MSELVRVFGVDVLLIGFGRPGGNAHAPNEWIDLGNVRRGRRAMRRVATTMFASVSLSLLHATSLAAQRTPVARPRRVVFVCEHGTVKSVVALEYFNRLARAKGLDFEAVSRGTHPDSVLPAPVRTGLVRDGFDVSRFRPSLFTAADLPSALLVVAFDADVDPVVAGTRPVARWDSLPSVMSNYAGGRTAIRAHVERLVDSLLLARRAHRSR